MLKVAALLLAIVVWSMINDAITSSSSTVSLPETTKVLKEVPVLVLGRASIAGDILLKPAHVNVTVKGPPEQVKHVSLSQITLYVDVTNIGGKDKYRQKVQYAITAWGVQVDRISPPTVEVEFR